MDKQIRRRMVLRETLRNSLQRLARHFSKAPPEGALLQQRPKLVGVARDVIANGQQLTRARRVDPAADQNLAGRDVKIRPRAGVFRESAGAEHGGDHRDRNLAG